jgi:RimJ/RimL family protein N-acetyltransferase
MIEYGKIRLRHVKEADLPFLERSLGDPIARGVFSPTRLLGPNFTRKRFAETGFSSDEFEALLVCDLDGAVVGQVIHFLTRGYTSSRELGWMVYDPERRGRGYASDAVRALVDYLFCAFPVHRLECCIHAENIASQKIARKCGFTLEGTLRGLFYVGGQYVDGELLSIVRPEWDANRSGADRLRSQRDHAT